MTFSLLSPSFQTPTISLPPGNKERVTTEIKTLFLLKVDVDKEQKSKKVDLQITSFRVCVFFFLLSKTDHRMLRVGKNIKDHLDHLYIFHLFSTPSHLFLSLSKACILRSR